LDRETKGRTRHNWTGLRNGLGYVRQNAGETVIWTICHIIGTRYNDIQRKKRLAEIRGKKVRCVYTGSRNCPGEEGCIHHAAE
jgi:hypothetical protein